MDFSLPCTIFYFFIDRSLLNPIVHGRSSHPMIIDERENDTWRMWKIYHIIYGGGSGYFLGIYLPE